METHSSNIISNNVTVTHYEPHEIIVRFVRIDDCSLIEDYPYLERCAYLQKQSECRLHQYMIGFMHLMYCIIQRAESTILNWLSIFALSFILFYFVEALGLLVGTFFVPCVNYFAKTLRMSQTVAGATVLGIANSFADLLGAFLDMEGKTTGLYEESHASAIFTHSLVAGTVFIIRPFHVYGPTYVRDAVFLLTVVTYIEYILKDDRVELFECIPLLLFYVTFLIMVAIDAILIEKLSAGVSRKLKMLQAGVIDRKN